MTTTHKSRTFCGTTGPPSQSKLFIKYDRS